MVVSTAPERDDVDLSIIVRVARANKCEATPTEQWRHYVEGPAFPVSDGSIPGKSHRPLVAPPEIFKKFEHIPP